MKKIVTENIFPPIPDRRFDWCAFFEGCEEDGNYGYGSTKQEAIDDLLRLSQEELEANMSEEEFAKHFPYAQE